MVVVYLHEALDRRLRDGVEITPEELLRATIDGSGPPHSSVRSQPPHMLRSVSAL